MKILTFRYDGNFTTQEFVVSDEAAEEVWEAFTDYVADPDPEYDRYVELEDEAEPLPPLPNGQRDYRRQRQRGFPGSKGIVRLSAVASFRVGPFTEDTD